MQTKKIEPEEKDLPKTPPFATQKKIELDEIAEEALMLLATSNQSFFLTWNGGTGKTTLINHFIEENSKLPENKQKKVQMLATTGAAAQLYEFGMTYHSFFRIFGEKLGNIDKDQRALMKYFDTYIIDEASMISASQFDLINRRLQQVTGVHDKLFGGKQIIFVGHLFQASPVVTEQTKEHYLETYHANYDDVYKSIFFFDAVSFDPKYFKIIELKKTHRTTDVTLQTYLKNLMLGENLNAVCHYFNQNFKTQDEIDYEHAIYIANTNSKVDKYNAENLIRLQMKWEKVWTSKAKYWGWDIDNLGRVEKEPAPMEVKYCVWARIIFTKNTDVFKNGTMWQIVAARTIMDELTGEDRDIVEVQIDKGPKITIGPATWNKYESMILGLDDDGNEILEHVIVGSFTQFPFLLGWGITAHKSQWKTFDKIIVDMGLISYMADGKWNKKAVEHIIYVALSRATSYKGIQIVQWLKPEAILVNKDVKEMTQKLIK